MRSLASGVAFAALDGVWRREKTWARLASAVTTKRVRPEELERHRALLHRWFVDRPELEEFESFLRNDFVLALAALDAEWEERARARRLVDEEVLRRLSRFHGRMHRRFPSRPTVDALRELVREDELSRLPLRITRWHTPAIRMHAARFGVPRIATVGALASHLGLEVTELLWLADVRGINEGKLAHYRTRWVPKRRGGRRLLEVPKPRLKRAQREVLRTILDVVPPHEAARAFRRGSNVHAHAELHAGKRELLTMDLEAFFPSVGAPRVRAIFGSLGYPRGVASVLTGLCTTASSLGTRTERERYGRRHLPQGAPTSPALANLAAYPLDVRLRALADAAGATYSRYADDLAFSGERVRALLPRVAAICLEERFVPQFRKTRVMTRANRQDLCGLVVNESPKPRRCDYDALRAMLHNCARHGPDSQNHDGHPDFRAHLEGRVAWHGAHAPHRAAKLTKLLARIPWPSE